MKAKKELNIQIGSRVKTARETMRYTQENILNGLMYPFNIFQI